MLMLAPHSTHSQSLGRPWASALSPQPPPPPASVPPPWLIKTITVNTHTFPTLQPTNPKVATNTSRCSLAFHHLANLTTPLEVKKRLQTLDTITHTHTHTQLTAQMGVVTLCVSLSCPRVVGPTQPLSRVGRFTRTGEPAAPSAHATMLPPLENLCTLPAL